MADVKISALPIGDPIEDANVFPAVQSTTTVKLTALEIATYVVTSLDVVTCPSRNSILHSMTIWDSTDGTTVKAILNLTVTESSNDVIFTNAGNSEWITGGGSFYFPGITSQPQIRFGAIGATDIPELGFVSNENVVFFSTGPTGTIGLQLRAVTPGGGFATPFINAPAGSGDLILGQSGLSSSSTWGFVYVNSVTSTPVSNPNSRSGYVPFTFDTSTNSLFFYNGGWVQIKPNTPGGSNGDIQVNNSGSFGGISGGVSTFGSGYVSALSVTNGVVTSASFGVLPSPGPGPGGATNDVQVNSGGGGFNGITGTSVSLSGPVVSLTTNQGVVTAASSVSPVSDGTYTVGIGGSSNGVITVTSGIITAIQQAS